MVLQPKPQFILNAGVAEVLQEDLRLGFRKYALGVGHGMEQHTLHAVRRRRVVQGDGEAHRVRPLGAIEVDDRLPGKFTVGDFDGDIINCSQAGRAPIDFRHFRVAVVHQQPISVLEGVADLQRDAGEDVSDQVLRRQADQHRGDSWSNQ